MLLRHSSASAHEDFLALSICFLRLEFSFNYPGFYNQFGVVDGHCCLACDCGEHIDICFRELLALQVKQLSTPITLPSFSAKRYSYHGNQTEFLAISFSLKCSSASTSSITRGRSVDKPGRQLLRVDARLDLVMYSWLKDCVARKRMRGGLALSSTAKDEHISTSVTRAVTMTISLNKSSRNRSDVIA